MTSTPLSDSQSYKLRHENFVTGLTGGPIDEIYWVTLIAISAYSGWCILQTRFNLFNDSNKWSASSLIIDLFLNWLAMLASITIYSSSPVLLNILIVTPVFGLLLMKPRVKRLLVRKKGEASSSTTANASAKQELANYLPKQSFLTNYRGSMMIITCIAILAVDFKIFPRKFAKVETWGTSLMDLGVGSFVFSMGVVSSRRTLIEAFSQEEERSKLKDLYGSFKSSVPVLTLGIIRLLAVKYLDYQEHVTEYGIHWNFFMTLGLLPPFVALVGFLPKKIPTFIVSLLIATTYELLLDKTSLGAFVLTAPRTNVVSSNKEGIFSFVGYLAIFLAGKSTGYYTLPSVISYKAFLFPQTKSQYEKAEENKGNSRYKTIGLLILSCVINNVLLYIVSFWLTPSRRLANLPYVLWVTSYNCGYLCLYILVELYLLPASITYENSVPISCEAVNTNGLAIFLLANILTGLVNMNTRTLDSTREGSMLILVLYSSFLFIVGVFLYKRGIRIKI